MMMGKLGYPHRPIAPSSLAIMGKDSERPGSPSDTLERTSYEVRITPVKSAEVNSPVQNSLP